MKHIESCAWEWTLAAGIALAVLLVTGLPYLVGWATSTPERIFTGFIIDVEDFYSHLAKMQLGYRGEWQYRILFTSEPHSGAYLNTFYIALGYVARLLYADLVLVYHAARLVGGLIFLLTAYFFITFFLVRTSERLLAFTLICWSSGLGWLALLLTGSYKVGGITPVDFWLIEMYGYFTVMLFPHTCIALAGLLLAFALALRYMEAPRWPYLLGAALATGVLSSIHAFMIPVVALTLMGYWAYQFARGSASWSHLPGLCAIWLTALPGVVYQYLVLAHNPIFAGWQAQNLTLSPPPWHYALGYGIVLGLALPGGWWALRQPRRWPLLVVWLLVVAPLLYAPSIFPIQRRVIEGSGVALCLLAVPGLTHYVLRSSERAWQRVRGWVGCDAADRTVCPSPTRWLSVLLVALTLPSTVLVITSAGLAAAAGHPDTVVSRAELAVVEWLAEHSQPEDVVLASYELSGFIAARSGRRVFMGHWTETINLPHKRAAAARFYSSADDTERQDLLRNYGIQYVVHGPRERAMGDFDPARVPYLQLVFRFQDVNIYRVMFGRP
ncbi:MAG: hypothetical protein NZ765_08765 [Anaerolineae bacterium]|nr:hypothetical protein [Anaerolineae bacterium]MDW8071624.1 hypothetical protein [Anaerolineae bacterium]